MKKITILITTLIITLTSFTSVAQAAWPSSKLGWGWEGDYQWKKSPRTGQNVRVGVTAHVYRYNSNGRAKFRVKEIFGSIYTSQNTIGTDFFNAVWESPAWNSNWYLRWSGYSHHFTGRDSGWVHGGNVDKYFYANGVVGLRTYFSIAEGGPAWKTEAGKDIVYAQY